MSQSSSQAISPRVVRILYAALCGGALGVAVVLGAVRATLGPMPAFSAAGVLRYVAIGAFVLNAAAAHVVRGRITPLASGADEAAWWVTNFPRALAVWALAESGVIVGVAIHFATGDWVPLGAAAAGLFVLWGARPEKLVAG